MFVVYCVGSGLCVELITRSVESYRVCVTVCDLETSETWRPGPVLDSCATEDINCLFESFNGRTT